MGYGNHGRLSSFGLASLAALGILAVAPALAPAVTVKTERISRPSPFSGPCTEGIGFARGFAQETALAVNPRNPREIVAGWIADGRATDLVAASRDGGRSFSRVLVPGLSACTGGSFKVASDPGLAFNANGRQAYFSAIVVNFESPTDATSASTGMVASRSFDGGFAWSKPTVIQPDTGDFWDLPRLTPHPRRPERAYYTYNQRLAPDFEHGYSLISTTKNGGRSWSTPRTLYDPQTPDTFPAINKLLVNRDGSLVVIFPLVNRDEFDAAGIRFNPTEMLAIRSVDGGRTWGEPIPIGRSSGRQITDPATGGVLNIFDVFPSQTVAPNGDLYVSWAIPGPRSSRVVVARSTNGGRSWQRDGFTVPAQTALATVEVSGDGGTVGVLYYEIARASRDGYWRTRVGFASSPDRGRSWRRDRIAGPFNLLTAGNDARPCCFLGDYLGSAPLPDGIGVAFSMAQPIAKNVVDAYFSRIKTPRR